ncbi:MAG: sulfurtransferase TusA family protein [Dehalococcoidia bacterium]|nr:sulfurtransferase TusA family protein [Dehalococcoidia bacterium]
MADLDISSLEIDKIVDTRGSVSPGPLLETKKAISEVGFGAVLEILSDDPETKKEIQVWAKEVGQVCMGIARKDGYERIFVLRRK